MCVGVCVSVGCVRVSARCMSVCVLLFLCSVGRVCVQGELNYQIITPFQWSINMYDAVTALV